MVKTGHSYVMINGVLYDTANMDEVYTQARPRTPFFWERRDGGISNLEVR